MATIGMERPGEPTKRAEQSTLTVTSQKPNELSDALAARQPRPYNGETAAESSRAARDAR